MQAVAHTRSGGTDLAADIGKLRRCGVGYLVLADYRARYLLLKEPVRVQRSEQVVDAGPAELIVGGVALYQAGALQNAGDAEKLCRIQAAAEIRAAERGADILNAGQRGASAHDHHVLCRACLREAAFDLEPVRARAQLQAGLPAALGDGLRRQHIEDRRKLQYVE